MRVPDARGHADYFHVVREEYEAYLVIITLPRCGNSHDHDHDSATVLQPPTNILLRFPTLELWVVIR
jgi:hypothetical protein